MNRECLAMLLIRHRVVDDSSIECACGAKFFVIERWAAHVTDVIYPSK